MAVTKWIEYCKKNSWIIRVAPRLKKEVSIFHFNLFDALRLGFIGVLGFLVVFSFFLIRTTQERSMVTVLKDALQVKDQELKTVQNQKIQVETLLTQQTNQLEEHLSELRREQDEIRVLLGKKKQITYENSPVAYQAARFGTKSSRGGPSYSGVIHRFSALQQQITFVQNELTRLHNLALIKHQEIEKERIAVVSSFDRIPSLWPTHGELTSGFGYRSLGGGEFHPGVDIATDYGSPIVAAATGRCAYAGFKSGFGLTVMLDHDNGLVTQYSHCSSLLVHEGEAIQKGERIASVGTTGYTTGPHVHYQMFYHGSIINPVPFLGLTVDRVASSGLPGLIRESTHLLHPGNRESIIPLASPKGDTH